MLGKSFGLYFYLKQSKNEKNASRYVYMRITVDGKSTELSTKRLWNQERWNGSAGRATGNKEDARNLNSYLETLSAKLYQAKKKLVETDKEITAETLKKVLLGTDEAKRMVLEIFNYHNQQVAALVGGEYAPGTLQRFQTTLVRIGRDFQETASSKLVTPRLEMCI